MKIITLALLQVLFLNFYIPSTLYAQCQINITGKNSTGSILTASGSGGTIKKLEWKKDGNTVAVYGSDNNGVTVAGGNGEGNAANQLDEPNGIFVDNNGNLWIADTRNARVQKFIPGCPKGTTIGATFPNAPEFPTNIFVCPNGDIFVADFFNSRVKKLARGGCKWVDVAGQNNEMKLTRGVWVDKKGNVYATDCGHNRVLKYAPHSSCGVVVAGGNGYGSALNQLARPASVVVDDDFNIYVADENNQRVVKWKPGAKCGILVAGYKDSNPADIRRLNNPIYAYVAQSTDDLSRNNKKPILYISNLGNNSVEKWLEGASEGTIVAGGNGGGDDADQLNHPFANFVFGNYLFVADRDNARIQRFNLSDDYVSNQFTATNPGNYSVTATFSNGCVITSKTIKISRTGNESIASSENILNAVAADGKSNNALFAYPNPVKNTVTINYSAKQHGKYVFELTELNGKVLLHKEINATQGLNTTTIDMGRFAKGIYFVNIVSADLRRQSIKLNKE
ncbi:MAG TPA: T9SS type A sorting domain-containing protein [Chitinophagaceae bacterium]